MIYPGLWGDWKGRRIAPNGMALTKVNVKY